jgi:hypothetical protein
MGTGPNISTIIQEPEPGAAQQDLAREEVLTELFTFRLRTSNGKCKPDRGDTDWGVMLSTDGRQVRRDVYVDGLDWDAAKEGWEPEGTIWPTWPSRKADESDTEETPLATVQKYWDESGTRLRDTSKWMATVLGAALATIVGASPLTLLKSHHSSAAIALGISGLALLFLTLFLTLQVMRPQTVSFADVQDAGPHRSLFSPPLCKWRHTVESLPDLYLPFDVKDLTSLRQSIIIEKMTLMALVRSRQTVAGNAIAKNLDEAQIARDLRLADLRRAAAQIAIIGEFYKIRMRSSVATYGGVLCALAGAICIIGAFIGSS